MLRIVLALAVMMHSVSICMGACAADEPKTCETSKSPCCQKKESAAGEQSSCCCSPKSDHRSKPKGEDCKCCVSPDEPLGMPPGVVKVSAPVAIDIISLHDVLATGWAAIAHDKHATENWLMRQGASTSHSVLCVWNN